MGKDDFSEVCKNYLNLSVNVTLKFCQNLHKHVERPVETIISVKSEKEGKFFLLRILVLSILFVCIYVLVLGGGNDVTVICEGGSGVPLSITPLPVVKFPTSKMTKTQTGTIWLSGYWRRGRVGECARGKLGKCPIMPP